MTGRTHYSVGVLYYLLFCMIPMFDIIQFNNVRNIFLGILAAAIGAIFPDADSDHSLINNRNPILKNSNKIVNNYKLFLKKAFAFVFFIIPCGLLINYMYRNNNYSIGFLICALILFILSIKGASLGEKIYIPVLSDGLRVINRGAAKVKKSFLMTMYIGLAIACIYLSKGSIAGIIWGAIFVSIAIFPHRTFLHSPEGIILITIGVKYLERKIMISNISLPFFVGYFSHLYLADIFTKSGVPVSSIPLILRKTKIHNVLKKYRFYSIIFTLLNKKLVIPLISTGSKTGNVFERIYVFTLFVLVFFVAIKNRAL